MGKYWLIFKNSFLESLIYRVHVFWYLLSEIITLAIFIALWVAIYAQGNVVGNYSLENLIIYYTAVHFIGFVIQNVDIAWRISDEINNGDITNFILRPISHLFYIVFRGFGKASFNLFIAVIIFIITLPLTWKFLAFLSWKAVLFFSLSLLISMLIFILFFYITGLFAFYLGTAQGLNFSFRTIMTFLSGYVIPLDLLPNWVLKINNFLPFKFINYIPVSILTGKQESIISTLGIGLLWVGVLFILAKLIFKKGIKKYEGFGA